MADVVSVFDALQKWGTTVKDVQFSYGPDNLPEKIDRGLPCLVVVEPGEDAINVASNAMMGNAFQVQIQVDQMLLCALGNVKLSKVYRLCFTMLRNYITALQANPFLTGSATPAHHGPIDMTPTWGQWQLADTVYWGFRCRYRMKINL